VRTLAQRHGLTFDRSRAHARIAQGEIAGKPVVLARPQTYMNLSGKAVAGLVRWLQITPAELLVIYDDIDLPLGKIRLRPKGSAGGHKGVQSIIDTLGTQDFPRLRVGIGRPADEDAVNYVLGNFTPAERQVIQEVYERVADAVLCLLTDGLEAAMNRYN